MLKVTNAEFVTDPYVAAAALLNYYPERPWGRHQPWPETAEKVKRGDASRLLRLLRCRLAWYGLRVEVGSVRLLTKDTLSVDLLQTGGAFLCRVEVDPQSGVIKTSASQASLRRLLASEWQLNNSPRRTSLMVQ